MPMESLSQGYVSTPRCAGGFFVSIVTAVSGGETVDPGNISDRMSVPAPTRPYFGFAPDNSASDRVVVVEPM